MSTAAREAQVAEQLARLEAERDDLNERMAADHRERTAENVRRRDAVNRRIARWRADGPPRSTPRQNVTANAADSHGVSRDIGEIGTDVPVNPMSRLCKAPGCGKAIPEYRGGRKVRADAETCSDACRKALERARRKAVTS